MSRRLPPVVVGLAFAAAMWLADQATPSLRVGLPGRAAATLVLALLGVAICLAGVLAFRRARTTTNPLRPDAASALVVDGIYAHTRNPMYVGFAALLLAWGAWLAHPVALVALPGFVAWVDRCQIVPEERALRTLFGEDFTRYCARVRRWI